MRLFFEYLPFWDVIDYKTLCNNFHNLTKLGRTNDCEVPKCDRAT